MRLLVVNPNTTRSMTEKIGVAARAVALPSTEIVAVNPDAGPPSIEGYYDEVFAIPGLIGEMRRAGPVDGTIIACFDDTGLEAARSFSAAPVIGIGEAAFHMAGLIAGKFSVVTTLSRSVPAIEHNLVRYGLVHTRAFMVEQGHIIGRPGTVYLEVDGEDEAISAVRVGGQAVTVITGTMRIP